MKRSHLYRLVLVAATGGIVLQTTSCTTQLLQTVGASIVEAATSALLSAITASLTSGLAA